MEFNSLLSISSLILAIVLIALILIQRPNTDSAGGFSSDSSGASYTKRGVEKSVYMTTLVVAVLFVVLQVFTLVLK